ncbi:hypothetical protein CRUP_012683 [Coryphaenoides rupestris]|nr:hypothetical protein CRUP_012683 [Coryphaenoides rupestris]
MSSLNSQESSNDICKLTDKQQAEYHDAYREYIAQMTQLDMSGGGGEKPVLPLPGQFLQGAAGLADDKAAKEGSDQDGRKPFSKRGTKPSGDATEFPPAAEVPLLDPISEEDEKQDHSVSSRTSRVTAAGPRYREPPSDEDEDSGSEEADNSTPLLHKETRAGAGATFTPAGSRPTGLLAKPGFLSEILLSKKDSSDSGIRPGDTSSDPSLEEEEEEEEEEGSGVDKRKAGPMELELEGLVKLRGLLPSGLQDAAVARMSICSEAASEASLMASSPDEGWPPGNLNSGDGGLDNSIATTNTNTNNSQQQHNLLPDSNTTTASSPSSSSSSSPSSSTLGSPPVVVITPGSGSTTTVTVHHNQNLRTISLGDERESVL